MRFLFVLFSFKLIFLRIESRLYSLLLRTQIHTYYIYTNSPHFFELFASFFVVPKRILQIFFLLSLTVCAYFGIYFISWMLLLFMKSIHKAMDLNEAPDKGSEYFKLDVSIQELTTMKMTKTMNEGAQINEWTKKRTFSYFGLFMLILKVSHCLFRSVSAFRFSPYQCTICIWMKYTVSTLYDFSDTLPPIRNETFHDGDRVFSLLLKFFILLFRKDVIEVFFHSLEHTGFDARVCYPWHAPGCFTTINSFVLKCREKNEKNISLAHKM